MGVSGVASVPTQVQIYIQKQMMNMQIASMQNLLSGLPQSSSIPEPGKGQNVDIRA